MHYDTLDMTDVEDMAALTADLLDGDEVTAEDGVDDVLAAWSALDDVLYPG